MTRDAASTTTAERAPRLLLIGNHTCGNRGDAAILRGLIGALQVLRPEAEIDVTSRHPTSSAYLLGRPVLPDIMDRGQDLARRGVLARAFAWLEGRLLPLWLASASHPRGRWLASTLPKTTRRAIEIVGGYDLVVQVGGSFFVDLYGNRQFEAAFAVGLAGRPLLLLGHSLGPFRTGTNRWFAARLLETAAVAALREPISERMLAEAGLPLSRVRPGADTAWLVPAARIDAPSPAIAGSAPLRRPTVAISLRDLAPFDRRLGIRQADYEAAFAALADRLIDQGYDILAVSSCTGIDSYHRDDRMPALRVQARVRQPGRMRVVMEELNDIELGRRLRECVFLVSTRLHCAIIAMNFGTPAIALDYEHKSEGIMMQAGLSGFATPVASLFDGRLDARIDALLEDLPETRKVMDAAVEGERRRAMTMIEDALDAYLPKRTP